jgi:hypothetical protein
LKKKFKQADLKLDYKRFGDRERRYYVKGPGSYILTIAERGGWQDAHFHNDFCELVIVQKGKVAVASRGSTISMVEFGEGRYFHFTEGQVHNIYMFPGSITHCIKYGNVKKGDWIPDEEFTKYCKTLVVE